MTSSSRNASPRTNANTSGNRCLMPGVEILRAGRLAGHRVAGAGQRVRCSPAAPARAASRARPSSVVSSPLPTSGTSTSRPRCGRRVDRGLRSGARPPVRSRAPAARICAIGAPRAAGRARRRWRSNARPPPGVCAPGNAVWMLRRSVLHDRDAAWAGRRAPSQRRVQAQRRRAPARTSAAADEQHGARPGSAEHAAAASASQTRDVAAAPRARITALVDLVAEPCRAARAARSASRPSP